MTTRHAQTEATAAPLLAAKRHLRLMDRAEVGLTEAGRFAVPLELCEGAAQSTPLRLVLTADEAVLLHHQLGALLVAARDGGA